MTATLRDIAERAGVSVRTVSYAVTNPDRVGAATLAKVRALIEEMQYEPNLVARGLRTGRSNLVGLIVPNVQMPYFAEITRELVAAFAGEGLTLVIDQTDGDVEREREFLAGGSLAASFDALVISPLGLTSEDLERRTKSTPVVLLGERVLQSPTDSVVIDNVQAAYDATRHLINRGYRKIAPVGPLYHDATQTSALRFEGFARALEESGLDPFAYQVKVHDFTRVEGVAAMKTLLDSSDSPDAVFCFNDLLALGAMRAARQTGISVPDELGIMGFDDIEDGRFAATSLSTVSPNKVALADETMKLVMERLEGSTLPPQTRPVSYEVIGRESTR